MCLSFCLFFKVLSREGQVVQVLLLHQVLLGVQVKVNKLIMNKVQLEEKFSNSSLHELQEWGVDL